MFNILEALYVHFSQPIKHNKLIEIQKILNMKKSTLTQLSDTRWICRFKSCDAIIKNYNAIVETLNYEIEEGKNKDVAQAIGMHNINILLVFGIIYLKYNFLCLGIIATITNYKFIVYLFILHDILKIINLLSVQLQSKNVTLGSSVNLIHGVINTLESYRSSEYFSNL